MNEDIINEEHEAIVIVGMAGNFPGASNVEDFWKNIKNSIESVRSFSTDELMGSGVDSAMLNNPLFVNAGAVMEDADCFDAAFFGISDKEAEMMDPQHRVFLETSWAALENSGYDPERYDGRIGIFGGVAPNTYLLSNLVSHPELLELFGQHATKIASAMQHAVTRVAYKLNLTGPAIGINTACSTSGVALHLACQSVLGGECDMALVGGARIKTPLIEGYLFEEGGIQSPDGHCRAFDEKAQGTVVGSGVGMIVIKRHSDAIEDGDTVHAIVKGSAINNDGSQKIGYTAPSRQGQEAVITEALTMAEVDPESVTYIETHGTGTSLGDPIEVTALAQAYGKNNGKKGYCAIGSVKTNIGHLDAGACVAGIIKTAYALKHKMLPPSINFKRPNPHIDFANSPFYVNTELRKWPAGNTPRRAGVSSFGIGGTNAHIILEEAPPVEASSGSRPSQLLLLSASTPAALESAGQNIARHLENNPDLKLSDVANTLQVGRHRFNHRRMVVCQNKDDAVQLLMQPDGQTVVTQEGEHNSQGVVFMFTGQGSQYVNMGRDLYQAEPVFREQVDYCAQLLQPKLGYDLREIIYPSEDKAEWAAQQLSETVNAQPALFMTEYALATLWTAWGVRPIAMTGHSIGEYVAACLSGVFSLPDALTLVSARGRMMQSLPRGSMLAVSLSDERILPLLDDKLSIAAVNAPQSCVVSGSDDAIADFEARLDKDNISSHRLHTSHAFHSPMVDPVLNEFAAVVAGVERKLPKLAFVSNVTGTWITDNEATDPDYWVKHLRETVRFSHGLSTLLENVDYQFLEVGPGQTLSTLLQQHSPGDRARLAIASLRHPKEHADDLAFMLKALGGLWLQGVDIDWAEFYSGEKRHRVPLPTYAFDRKRYWIEPSKHIAYEALEKDSKIITDQNDDQITPLSVNSQLDNLSQKDQIILRIKDIIYMLTGQEQAGINIHVTFLHLGLDSLLMARANTAFQNEFGVRITLHQLFNETPTIVSLAEVIDLIYMLAGVETLPDKTRESYK